MSKEKYVYLVYQKDFTENGGDRYFLYNDGEFSEVAASDIVSLDCFVVTHDFWLISNSLYKKCGKLPNKLVDVVLMAKIVAGTKSVKGSLQPWDISKTIRPLYKKKQDDFDDYMSMYYRRRPLDLDVYMLFSRKLAEYADVLFGKAEASGESERYFCLEMPVYNELVLASCKGIRVCNDKIRGHKQRLKWEFYRELKQFAEKHNVLYELPNEGEAKENLSRLGYKVDGYSLEFLTDLLPSHDGYTDDLKSLQKTNKSYRVFNSISSSADRLRPIVESHWTSTARIYHKSPSIQNISKRYRDIFIAEDEFSLCYVDYDQFEVGVMAAISGDPKMKHIYENTDTYKDLAQEIFNDVGLRKKAKTMFFSYTYGMSLENLMISVSKLDGDTKKAKEYFLEFTVFEEWKKKACDLFQGDGRIPTISANYLNRQVTGELSAKEKRTVVSHVIQGSATYIFKKALLELSKQDGVQILIPMHDAVLFEHRQSFDPKSAVSIFEDAMTSALGGSVKGKASIEAFFPR